MDIDPDEKDQLRFVLAPRESSASKALLDVGYRVMLVYVIQTIRNYKCLCLFLLNSFFSSQR